jgi:hypothetical protein
MTRKSITTQEKIDILNRDGWCCNMCGYVPFHRFHDVPFYWRQTWQLFNIFINDLKLQKPIIFPRWKKLPNNQDGTLNMDFCYLHGGELEFDHVIPMHANGLHSVDNIQALCHNCHRIKSNFEYRYTVATKYCIQKWGGLVC